MQLFHRASNGRFYHRDRGQREPFRSEFWAGKRKKFIIANLMTIVLLCILVLVVMSDFYGSTYDLNVNVHHFKILHIDYDGGVVGRALTTAYERVKGDDFPTLITGNPQDYAVDELRHKVCHDRHIWGAIYSAPDASRRLSSALAGGASAEHYNSSDEITFIWNSARYTTLSEANIMGNLQSLIFGANTAYFILNGTYAYSNVNTSSSAALDALAQPFNPLSVIDLHPIEQGARVLYNTVTIVITVITQFFFVMAINGMGQSFQIFTRLGLIRNLRVRWTSSLLYSASLAASLTGVIWAFRNHWQVTASQGVETWLLLFWECHIHFLFFDTVTGWIPQHLIAFLVLSWVIINVTSTVVPLPLAPGFYHWQYALPSYEAYQLLVTIWSRGCVPQNFRAIPILFAWWVAGFAGSWASMVQKCNTATKLANQQAAAAAPAEKDPEKAVEGTPSQDSSDTAVGGTTEGIKSDHTGNERPVMNSPTPFAFSITAPFQDRLGLTPVRTAPIRPKPNMARSHTAGTIPSLRSEKRQ